MSINLLTEAKKLIGIDSTPFKSNKPVVDYLSTLIAPLKLEIELQKGELFGNPQYNLIARKGPKEKGGLVLNTHIDTVLAGDFSLWDKTGGNPFRATIHDDKIFGLGVADVKLDILCKIKALEKFKDTSFNYPLALVATYGEESGLVGAKQLMAEKKVEPQYALVGEASNLSIVYAHKGHIALEIIIKDKKAKKAAVQPHAVWLDFRGKAAHSSTPQLGSNAVEAALNFLKENHKTCQLLDFTGGELINIIPANCTLTLLGNEAFDQNNKKYTYSTESIKGARTIFSNSFLKTLSQLQMLFAKLTVDFTKDQMAEFNPPCNLINITKAQTKDNTVRLEIGVRTLPTLNTKEWILGLRKSLESIQSHNPDTSIQLNVIRESYAMMTSPNGKLVSQARSVLRDLGIQDTVITKAGATEACLYEKQGAQVIVWGPGVAISNIHKPNEYNYLHHLTSAVSFYERMIEAICIKGI